MSHQAVVASSCAGDGGASLGADDWPLVGHACPPGRALAGALERAPLEGVVATVFGTGLRLLTGDLLAPWSPPGRGRATSPLGRLLGDPSAQVADVATFVLHLLHPGIAALFADHPELRRQHDWSRSPLLDLLVALGDDGSCGAAAAASDLRDRLRSAVGSRPDGVSYHGDDPELLRWLVLGHLSCLLAAYGRFGPRPLDAEQAADVLAQGAPLAELLGIEPLPKSIDALRRELDTYRPRLGLTTQGRRLLDDLVVASPRPERHWPSDAARTAAAWEVLPAWARSMLGLQAPWPLRAGLGRAIGEVTAELARLCRPRQH